MPQSPSARERAPLAGAAGGPPPDRSETSAPEPASEAMPDRTAAPAGSAGHARDLRSALLGSGASAGEQPEAVRDTVAAIEELFPGTLVATTPRAGGGQDEDGDGAVGDGADGDSADGDTMSGSGDRPDDDAAADEAIDEPGAGTGGTRLDFGPRDP